MKSKPIFSYLKLHIILMFFSVGAICSKMAAGYDFLSFPFILFYSGLFLTLGVYAIFWQQIIKELPLSTAYANKAVTIIWSLIWGAMFFDEDITMGKILGAVIVICGVILYAFSDREEVNEK